MPNTLEPGPRILAIDPGDAVSGWVRIDAETHVPDAFGTEAKNEVLLQDLVVLDRSDTVLVVETFQPRGQPLYWQLIWTAIWTGRFIEAWENRGGEWAYMHRETAKHTITGRTASKDGNVRAALIDRFGGKESAVGTKKSPGPLFGISKHAWPALAVAVAYAEGARSRAPEDVRSRNRSTPRAHSIVVEGETAKAAGDPTRRPIRRTRR